MQKRSRPISHRLARARTPEKKGIILHEWADKWLCEHIDIVERLKDAIDNNNINTIRIALGELRAVTEKKHTALHNIFDSLTMTTQDKDNE